MAHPSASSLSYLGIMSTGAMMNNEGFAPATQEITNILGVTANSILTNVTSARIKTAARANIYPETQAAMRTLGNRDISGSGAFTNSCPEVYSSSVGTGSALDKLSAHTALMFGNSPLQMAQTFQIADSLVSTSAQMAPILYAANSNVSFGIMPGLDKLQYPANGVFPKYLGRGYSTLQDVVTNGISAMVSPPTAENIQLLATDFKNLGNALSLDNKANFGNPGQLIASVAIMGGLGASGIDAGLAGIGINIATIYNPADPAYNELMAEVLAGITSKHHLMSVQAMLGSNISNMTSLLDYFDIDKVFINSKDVKTFKSFAELRTILLAIELGRIETTAELGDYIATVGTVVLPTISNTTQFINRTYTDIVSEKFIGGTGQYGSITFTDMIGTLGGVGISDQVAAYNAAMNRLYTAGELTALAARIDQLNAGLDGDYTTTDVVSGDGGPVTVYTITDPNGGTYGPDTAAAVYSSFVNSKIGQIEAALADIMSRANVNADIDITVNNWIAIYKKVYTEKDFQSRIDMNYANRTNYPDIAYYFVSGLRSAFYDAEKLSIITAMITQSIKNGSLGGEYFRAYMAELQNRDVADAYDIRWRAELH